MIFRPSRLMLGTLLALVLALPAGARAAPPVEDDIQGFLAAQAGPLAQYHDIGHSAAEIVGATSAYYGVSPRILLALLEATGALLSDPTAPAATLARP
ncbi:MAG TPA: hypothetical protein PLO33_17815, partial [Kouleothrix sp.]|nr:hypothetical protein [Kouleothrix sp.]